MEDDNFVITSEDKKSPFVNRKIAAEIAVGIILFVAIIFGGIFYLQRDNKSLKFINIETLVTTQSRKDYNLVVNNLSEKNNPILYKLNFEKYFDKSLNKNVEFLEYYFLTGDGGAKTTLNRLSGNVKVDTYGKEFFAYGDVIPVDTLNFGVDDALKLVYDNSEYKNYVKKFPFPAEYNVSGAMQYDKELKRWSWLVSFEYEKNGNSPAVLVFIVDQSDKSVKTAASYNTLIASDGAYYVIGKDILDKKCLPLFDYVKKSFSRLSFQCNDGDNFGVIDFYEYKDALLNLSFNDFTKSNKNVYMQNGKCEISNLNEFEYNSSPGIIFDCGDRTYVEYAHNKNALVIESYRMHYFGVNQDRLMSILKTFK